MRSLLAVVDEAALHTPHDAWVYLPSGEGWTPMTWLQLQRAVDNMTAWMDLELGPANGDTIAYMAINDVRYPVAMLAAMRAGYKLLLTSPRNSVAGHSSLLSSTACQKLLYTPELQDQVEELVSGHDASLETFRVPQLSDLHGERRPLSKPPELSPHDTVMILHSSGTTGLPKPIPIKAGALAVIDTIKEMPAPPGRQNLHDVLYSPTPMISMLPSFHIMGIATLARSIYHHGPLILLPPDRPPTADLIIDAINTAKPSAIACAPSVLEDMSSTSRGIEALSLVDHVFYGGAPLSRSSGDRISRVTRLLNAIGSTELLNVPSYVSLDPTDWEYFEWNPAYGAVMEPVGGSSELVVKHKYSREHQLVFHNFPDVSEWRTGDLFEPHPTKRRLWRYTGRIDDTLVLSNGEKVSPVAFEKAVEGHELVRGALLVGSRRFQTALIVEPRSSPGTDFVDQLWPTIEAANADLPSYARVWRSMVTLSRPDKPFRRAPKGSVLRRATGELYEEEINQLYDPAAPRPASRSGTLDAVRESVRVAVRSVLRPLADGANFFLSGMDSLRVLHLSRLLLDVRPADIYQHPTIDSLSLFLYSNQGINGTVPSTNPVSREERMSTMIYRYTKDLRKPAVNGVQLAAPPTNVVVLTGSTGSLGTFLLSRLLSDSTVTTVYCLNRSEDAPSRQEHAFRDRDLDPNLLQKVVFLTVDLSKPDFSLSPSQYQRLRQETTLIIHNAWPVSFNHGLDYFEPAIAGTRRLIDLALASAHHPRLVLVSSIASAGNFAAIRPGEPVVPEELEEDNSMPLAQGYGESKHVASCIVAKAARRLGLHATVVRVGQLSGPRGAGKWNTSEWLPSLVQTSKNLGKIPSSLGGHDFLDWVPVDTAADILLELATRPVENLECFNLVSPRLGQWQDMVRAIQAYSKGGKSIKGVGFGEWIEELDKVEVTDNSVIDLPALKLVDFYKQMAAGTMTRFATERGEMRSGVMASLEAVDEELMRQWLVEWDQVRAI